MESLLLIQAHSPNWGSSGMAALLEECVMKFLSNKRRRFKPRSSAFSHKILILEVFEAICKEEQEKLGWKDFDDADSFVSSSSYQSLEGSSDADSDSEASSGDELCTSQTGARQRKQPEPTRLVSVADLWKSVKRVTFSGEGSTNTPTGSVVNKPVPPAPGPRATASTGTLDHKGGAKRKVDETASEVDPQNTKLAGKGTPQSPPSVPSAGDPTPPLLPSPNHHDSACIAANGGFVDAIADIDVCFTANSPPRRTTFR